MEPRGLSDTSAGWMPGGRADVQGQGPESHASVIVMTGCYRGHCVSRCHTSRCSRDTVSAHGARLVKGRRQSLAWRVTSGGRGNPPETASSLRRSSIDSLNGAVSSTGAHVRSMTTRSRSLAHSYYFRPCPRSRRSPIGRGESARPDAHKIPRRPQRAQRDGRTKTADSTSCISCSVARKHSCSPDG